MSQKKAPPKRGLLILFCGNEALFFQAFDQRRIFRAGQGSFFVDVIAPYCECVCRRSQIFRLCSNEVAYCYRWGLRGIAIWSLGQEDMRLWEVMPKQI